MKLGESTLAIEILQVLKEWATELRKLKQVCFFYETLNIYF